MGTFTDLKAEYMYANKAAAYLMTTERKLSLYRKYKLLRFAKLGKNYVYKRSWLDQFMEDWSGYDLSNESKVQLAINAKKWKNRNDSAGQII